MREDMRNIMAWVKAARRNGLLEDRCTEEWEGRRIHTESPLRLFSQEEVAQIILLNNHLKALTKEAKAKAERIPSHMMRLTPASFKTRISIDI